MKISHICHFIFPVLVILEMTKRDSQHISIRNEIFRCCVDQNGHVDYFMPFIETLKDHIMLYFYNNNYQKYKRYVLVTFVMVTVKSTFRQLCFFGYGRYDTNIDMKIYYFPDFHYDVIRLR